MNQLKWRMYEIDGGESYDIFDGPAPVAVEVKKEYAPSLARVPEMLALLESIAKEADRAAKGIGASARRGDQGTAETFRWIRDAANKLRAEAGGKQ